MKGEFIMLTISARLCRTLAALGLVAALAFTPTTAEARGLRGVHRGRPAHRPAMRRVLRRPVVGRALPGPLVGRSLLAGRVVPLGISAAILSNVGDCTD